MSLRDLKVTALGNLITDILLQNLKVLAINQNANDADNKTEVPSAVTFEVTPVQAQKLVLAQRLGSLSLTLRHVTNVAPEVPKTVTLRDLKVGEANLSPGAPATPVKKTTIVVKTPKKKKEGLSVRVVRGLSTSKYEVQPERKPLFSAQGHRCRYHRSKCRWWWWRRRRYISATKFAPQIFAKLTGRPMRSRRGRSTP